MNMGEIIELNLYVTLLYMLYTLQYSMYSTDSIPCRSKLTLDPSTKTLINKSMRLSRTIELVKLYFPAFLTDPVFPDNLD